MKIFATIVFAVASIAGTSVAAKPEKAAISVSYADLDMSSEAGKAKLSRRLDTAARSVCGGNYSRLDVSVAVTNERCYRETVAAARNAIPPSPAYASR